MGSGSWSIRPAPRTWPAPRSTSSRASTAAASSSRTRRPRTPAAAARRSRCRSRRAMSPRAALVYEHVAFDLDGTLIDSRADLTAAVNHVLRRLRPAELPPAHRARGRSRILRRRLGARARGARRGGGGADHCAPARAGRGRGGRVSDPVPFARSGAYPPRPGNAVRPLVDGEPAFRRIAAAVESARASVWVTVAFVERDLVLPGARGTLFDLLDRAAARGLDVRALFWREPELGRLLPGASHFAGGAEERAWLAARGTRWLARWDHLPRYCHHQKSWLVDAGRPGEVAFVGRINP